MIRRLKYTLRNKLVGCTKEGVGGLEEKVNHLAVAASSLQQDILNLRSVSSGLVERNYTSSEYILDSLCASRDNKKRVLICGFYGGRNLGDELMLQSILKRLDSKDLDITIMLAPHIEVDASVYAPYRVIHYPSRNNDILLLAQNYDYIIWGGGAVLDDLGYEFRYQNSNLGYILLKLSIAALKCNKKVYVLGVSTNQKLSDSSFLKDLQYIIDNSSFFSLRDTESFQTLENAGISTKGIRLVDDLAIADVPKDVSTPSDTKVFHVGMTFLLDDDNSPKVERFLRLSIQEILPHIQPSPKLMVHLIPFYDQGGSDIKLFSNIVNNLGFGDDVQIVIEDFSESMSEIVDILSSCNYIFSMRYHAVLISLILGIPVLSIDYGDEHRHYHNKLTYLSKKYGNFDKIPFGKIDDKLVVTEVLQKALGHCDRKEINVEAIKDSDGALRKVLKHIH